MKESDKKKIGEAYLRLHSCNEEEGMTDEEAIKIIKQFRDRQGNSSDDNEALDLAIKALEQQQNIHDTCKKCVEFSEFEPQFCEDAISRQAVIDINEYHHGQMPNHVNHEIWKEIKALPSVTPQPNKSENPTSWIPVTERLPEEETDVLVCNENGDIEITSGSYSTEFENHFMWYTSGWRFGEVLAWMPLPEKWEGDKNEA